MRKVTILDRKFKSLLDELDYAPRHNRDLFIESRAQQVIASVTHLMKLIRESYNEEDADDLHLRVGTVTPFSQKEVPDIRIASVLVAVCVG